MDSKCYGTTSNGRLENGVQLPSKGNNFTSYGTVPELLGRTYVHSLVKKTIIDAYRYLEKKHPGKVFKYAETGFKAGGEFKPHKTHRNGLSVDFIVSVINTDNDSVYLPTNMLNKYGYAVEFDSHGKHDEYVIDFEAIGAHIVALHKLAKKNNIGIWRVIFAPDLQPHLYNTQYGQYIKKNILIPTKKSWVRHDDHYHVDFKVQCYKQ